MRSYLCIVIVVFLGCTVAGEPIECFTSKDGSDKCAKEDDTCVSIYDPESGKTPVWQGCYEQLEEKHRKLCDEDSELCVKCDKTKCNTWDEATECYICDGPGCVTIDTTNTEQTFCPPGKCYTELLTHGTNKRGCLRANQECDKSKGCTHCTGPLCNGGLYPEDRRQCNVKDGDTTSSTTCVNPKDDCLTVLDEHGTVAKLGCKEALYTDDDVKKLCEGQSSSRCIPCHDNNCNEEKQYNKCLACDRNDPNCLNKPSESLKDDKNVKYCDDKCYLQVNGEDVSRGCLKDCRGDNGQCEECESPFCSRKCYNEDGDVKLCNDRQDECVSIFDEVTGQAVDRGCFEDLQDNALCKGNSPLCQKCKGDLCNKHKLNKCYVCKEGDCLTIKPEQAQACPSEVCYVKLLKGGKIERGCWDEAMGVCEGEDCTTCEGDLCNEGVFPEGRRQCLVNGGAHEVCLNQTDTCLTVLKQDGTPSALGCTSRLFEQAAMKKMCEKYPSRCVQCSTNDCNKDQPYTKCAVCNEKDVDCLENPEKIDNFEYCPNSCFVERLGESVVRGCIDKHPEACEKESCLKCKDGEPHCKVPNECFTSKDGDSKMCAKEDDKCVSVYEPKSDVPNKQGCLEELDENSKEICETNPERCYQCETRKCNKWKEAIVCIACQGIGCLTTTPDSKSEFCHSGTCITRLDKDGTNTRGCLKPGEECEAENCKPCDTSLCNADVYPDYRMQCNVETGGDTYCANPKDTCLTVLKSTGMPVKMGCTREIFQDSKLEALCKKDPNRCLQCKTSKCNENRQHNKCLKCDESVDNCVEKPGEVAKPQYDYCLGQCFVEVNDKGVKRGCGDEHVCSEPNCLTCDAPFCEKLPKLQECYISKTEVKQCEASIDRCATIYNHRTGEPVAQGCLAELNDDDKVTCSIDKDTCSICDGPKCNKWEKGFQCFSCSGDDCFLPNKDQVQVCGSKNCFTKISSDGSNVRGCLVQQQCDEPNCEKCSKDLCNNKLFPRDRRICHRNDEKSYCFKPDDVCYTAVDSDGRVKRGCLQEAPAGLCTDDAKCNKCSKDGCNSNKVCLECDDKISCANPGYCFANPKCFFMNDGGVVKRGCAEKGFCDGKPNCNECDGDVCNNKEVHAGTSCHTCEGKEECATHQSGETIPCHKHDDKCYVYTNGTLIKRGCSESLGSRCEGPNCAECDQDGCNSFALEKYSCYQCGNADRGCGPDLDDNAIKPKECPHYNLPAQNTCYAKQNGGSERGCLSPSISLECPTKTCEICSGNGCNNKKIPNSVGRSQSNYTIWVASLAALFITWNLSLS